MSGSDIDADLDRHEHRLDQIDDEIGELQWAVNEILVKLEHRLRRLTADRRKTRYRR